MKSLLLRLATGVTATVLLTSCFSMLLPASPRRVPYNEAAFAPYDRTGSGTVTGHVSHHPKDNSPWVIGPSVRLFPDNAYTQEYVERVFVRRENLQRSDRCAARYEREAQTGRDGNFAFRDVPPGKYIIACLLTYDDGVFDQTNGDGSFTLVPLTGSQWVYARVSVRNGQTVRVERWTEGK